MVALETMELNPQVKQDLPLPPPPEEDDTIDECRLWIGNISPQITEFTLLKTLQKFGPLKKYDFLYHKSGPDLGKPRGYCFVTYELKEIAEKARKSLHGKLAVDRRLVVRHAHLDKREEEMMKRKPLTSTTKVHEPAKPVENELSTECKIAAIEAKLRMMEKNEDGPSTLIPPPRQPVSITTLAENAAQAAKSFKSNNSRSYHNKRPYDKRNRRR